MAKKSKLSFRDIPKFTRSGSYEIDVSLSYLPDQMKTYIDEYELDMDPDFQRGDMKNFVLVDGKQRLEACRRFSNNEIPVFGHFLKDYNDKPDLMDARLRFNVNNLKTRAEVLQWYIDLNSGGVVHTTDEIEKVKKLLEKEKNSGK